jgi:hypothetical protein
MLTRYKGQLKLKDWAFAIAKRSTMRKARVALAHGLVLLRVADGVFSVGCRGADGFGDVLRSIGSVDMHNRSIRSATRLRKRIVKPVPMGGGLGQAQAALAPQDASQFLDQVLLRRPLRPVLGNERRDQGVVLVRVLPGQHGVARQHAVAQRIEAASHIIAQLYRSCALPNNSNQRHEQSCAYAADGWARTTATPGVCSVTAGCGLTNASGWRFCSKPSARHAAVRQYCNDNKVPQVFVGGSGSIFSDPQHFPWTIGFGPSNLTDPHIFARHILATKPDAKIGVLYQNDATGKDYLIGLQDVLGAEHAGMVIKEVSCEVLGAYGRLANRHPTRLGRRCVPDRRDAESGRAGDPQGL